MRRLQTGPTPRTENRRFDIYNSFKQIHGKKSISGYTTKITGGCKSEMGEI